MIKVQQGYVLPAEVQAALLLMPRPDPTALRASYDLGKQLRPPPVVGNLHSPPRKSKKWKVTKKEEVAAPKITVHARERRAPDLLRKKLRELEKREDLSAATLTAIKELLDSQTDRQNVRRCSYASYPCIVDEMFILMDWMCMIW